MKKTFLLLLLVIVIWFPICSEAETITLKSGQEIEGKILEKTDQMVIVEWNGVRVSYNLNEVSSISENSSQPQQPETQNASDNSSNALSPQEAFDNGNKYAKREMFDEAIVEFTKAIELNPNYALAYSNRATAYIRQKNYTQAITDCDRAIQINPDLAVVYLKLFFFLH